MIDDELFYFINGLAGKWVWLDVLAVFIAQYLPYVAGACLVLFLIKDYKKYWPIVVSAAGAALLGRFVFLEIIRLLHDRFRPFLGAGVNALLTYPTPQAFPSGHATVFFAITTIVFFYNKKAGFVFLAASLLIGLARVFVGLHWPLDIAAGIIVGIAAGLLTHNIFRRIQKNTLTIYKNKR